MYLSIKTTFLLEYTNLTLRYDLIQCFCVENWLFSKIWVFNERKAVMFFWVFFFSHNRTVRGKNRDQNHIVNQSKMFYIHLKTRLEGIFKYWINNDDTCFIYNHFSSDLHNSLWSDVRLWSGFTMLRAVVWWGFWFHFGSTANYHHVASESASSHYVHTEYIASILTDLFFFFFFLPLRSSSTSWKCKWSLK